MIQLVGTIASAAWPIVTSLFVIACLYGRAALDAFGDKAVNNDGLDNIVAYFSTYSRSLSTFFRIFIGEGWAAIMYSASDATTGAARVFFFSFTMLATVLFAQLIIGVIVKLFAEVKRLDSEQLYSCLSDFTGTDDATARHAIENDILKLNTVLLPLHEALDIFDSATNASGPVFDKHGETEHIFFQSLRSVTGQQSQGLRRLEFNVLHGRPTLSAVVAAQTR